MEGLTPKTGFQKRSTDHLPIPLLPRIFLNLLFLFYFQCKHKIFDQVKLKFSEMI